MEVYAEEFGNCEYKKIILKYISREWQLAGDVLLTSVRII